MRVWLDTDLGTDVDDALALAYVLRHPDMELCGISTVFGDVPLRTEMVNALLAMTDVEQIPVVPGMGVPLTERRNGIMFGHEGRCLLPDPEPTLRLREEQGATDRVHALADELTAARPDVVVAIGPLTNLGALAAAGLLGEDWPPLAIMGGKLQDVMLPGMVEYISEWNWFCDPVAVQHVLQTVPATAQDSVSNVIVVPAEVTFHTRLEDEDIQKLADGDELDRCLASLCREWLRTQAEDLGVERPLVALHDPLTVAVLNEPQLCTFEPRDISVDDSGATTVGDGTPNILAASSVDPVAARAHVTEVLTGAATSEAST